MNWSFLRCCGILQLTNRQSNMFKIPKPNYKTAVIVLLLGAWGIFSAAYVAYDQWQDFQTRGVQAAFQEGTASTIRAIMQRSEECQTVSLYDGDKSISVVSVSCLRLAGVEEESAPAPTPAPIPEPAPEE